MHTPQPVAWDCRTPAQYPKLSQILFGLICDNSVAYALCNREW